MNAAQVVTWGEAAQKIVVVVMLPMLTAVGSWGAAELGSLKRDIQDLRVEVAMLKVELKMHREQERN